MVLNLRENLAYVRWLRVGVVAGVVLALLAFPCGPFAAAFGSDTGHALAAAKGVPGHGGAECSHRVKKHESSCCNDCSSWLTSRIDDDTTAILSHASHRDLPAVTPAYTRLNLVGPDQEQRLTGPPLIGSLYDTSLYARTQRYRI